MRLGGDAVWMMTWNVMHRIARKNQRYCFCFSTLVLKTILLLIYIFDIIIFLFILHETWSEVGQQLVDWVGSGWQAGQCWLCGRGTGQVCRGCTAHPAGCLSGPELKQGNDISRPAHYHAQQLPRNHKTCSLRWPNHRLGDDFTAWIRALALMRWLLCLNKTVGKDYPAAWQLML